MGERAEILRRNLATVQERIRQACVRAGRQTEEVTLVAITKYVDVTTARMLLDLGVRDLGENRPQELWAKAAAIPEARWHLVGHLQRNKIARTLPLVHLIHSVDSLRLLEALEQASGERGVDVLLEFNLSGERTKTGFAPESWPEVTALLPRLRNVRVRGLMTMAALHARPGEIRDTFARLRQMRDRYREAVGDPAAWPELSMGMSGDCEIAVEEGATLVRIGSALFEGLEP